MSSLLAVASPGTFVVACHSQSGGGAAFYMNWCGRTKDRFHSLFGRGWPLVVLRVEHGNHCRGADGIFSGPLAVNQRALHRLPVLCIGFHKAVELRQFAGAV